MLPGLRRVADEWRPDLIVRESWEYGSTIVAEERGIPLARVGLGVAGVEDGQRARGRPRGRRGARAAGLPADPDGERMRATPYFSAMPSALEDPAVPLPPRTLRFRTAEVPEPAVPDAEPLVYVSFGSVTASAHLPYYPALYRAAIDVLAPLPARFLVTVGEDRDLGELGPLPRERHGRALGPAGRGAAHAARSSPTAATARRSARSPTGCRSSVVPLFALDQWFNAEAVERAGAGVALGGERADAPRDRPAAARRRWRRCGRRSNTCSPTRARARRAQAIADAMRALPPVDRRCPRSRRSRVA